MKWNKVSDGLPSDVERQRLFWDGEKVSVGHVIALGTKLHLPNACITHWCEVEPPEEELLPCPECGSSIIESGDDSDKKGWSCHMKCDNCGFGMTMGGHYLKKLASRWNELER